MTTRQLDRRSLLGAAVLCCAAGCAPGPAAPRTEPLTTPPPPAEPESPRDRVATLLMALRSGDGSAFAGCFAVDERGRSLAARLWRNWRALGVRALAGSPDGDATRLTVTWAPFGDADEVLDEVVAPGGDALVDVIPLGRPPVWLDADLTLTRRGDVAVISDAGVKGADVQRWRRASATAARRVAGAGLAAASARWRGRVLTVVPADLARFRSLTGVPGAEASGVGAVTQLPSEASHPLIVVNPVALRGASAAGDRLLLTHEAVHVATRSPLSGAPDWAVEGLAESVCNDHDAAANTHNRRLARERVRARGVPDRLPAAADLYVPPDSARTEYALAEAAVEAMAARWGRERMVAWVADWAAPGRPSDAELLRCYRAALRRLS